MAAEEIMAARQASSSGGADPGPGEGVPGAGSAIHETALPLVAIGVQDSPAHETAAVGARSSRGLFAAAYDGPAMPPDDSQRPHSSGTFIG